MAALAQETRLDIYRLLVQAGEDGLAAGKIGEELGLPSATLAFHLKELKHAGLVTFTREGRSLIYAAIYPTMNALLAFLTENCCGRPSCRPPARMPATRANARDARQARQERLNMSDNVMATDTIKDMVRARYGDIAASADSSCCAPAAATSCCGTSRAGARPERQGTGYRLFR